MSVADKLLALRGAPGGNDAPNTYTCTTTIHNTSTRVLEYVLEYLGTQWGTCDRYRDNARELQRVVAFVAQCPTPFTATQYQSKKNNPNTEHSSQVPAFLVKSTAIMADFFPETDSRPWKKKWPLFAKVARPAHEKRTNPLAAAIQRAKEKKTAVQRAKDKKNSKSYIRWVVKHDVDYKASSEDGDEPDDATTANSEGGGGGGGGPDTKRAKRDPK
jgi:hypothetical protein